MNRGDIWQVDLKGRAGKRPALILARQAVIPHLNKLTVAEVTTQGKGYPTEYAIGKQANLPHDSFVQLDNIQTIAKSRFVKYLGHLDDGSMKLIGGKAILALGLEDCYENPGSATPMKSLPRVSPDLPAFRESRRPVHSRRQ